MTLEEFNAGLDEIEAYIVKRAAEVAEGKYASGDPYPARFGIAIGLIDRILSRSDEAFSDTLQYVRRVRPT